MMSDELETVPDSTLEEFKIIEKQSQEFMNDFTNMSHNTLSISMPALDNVVAAKETLFISPDCTIFDEAAQQAGIRLIKTKSEDIKRGDISKLPYNRMLGLPFEEITAGRVLQEAKNQGMDISRIEGDGLGVLPNGMKSPEYLDLIFVDNKTKEYNGNQLKFTDDPKMACERVSEFYNKWGEHDQPGLPAQLKPANINIIVPKGLADKIPPFEHKTVPIPKKFQSAILFGNVTVEVPSHENMKKWLQKNFKVLQELEKTRLFQKDLEKKVIKSKKQTSHIKNAIEIVSEEKTLVKMDSKITKNNLDLAKHEKDLENVTNDANNMKTKIVSTDKETEIRKCLRNHNLKMFGKSCLIGAFLNGVTTFTMSSNDQIRKYKSGNITGDVMVKNIAFETLKASAQGALISGTYEGSRIAFQYLESSEINVLSKIGGTISWAFRPASVIASLSFQTYCIMGSYNNGTITLNERNRRVGRILARSALNIGATAAVTTLIGSGHLGSMGGIGACLAMSLLDYAFGNRAFSYFFGSDENDQFKLQLTLEERVENKAYEMFGLENDCTDLELQEAKEAALFKYRPEKGHDNNQLRDKYQFITRTFLVAFTFLMERRNNHSN